jgi:polysaccharide export outer membrane protein
MNLPVLALVAALTLVASAGCKHTRDFMWVDEVPRALLADGNGYQIAAGDVIGVRVWNQEANSVERARVREDGMVTIPFLDDVRVAGLSPPDLARFLETKLKAFINSPSVTVVVHERRPLRVSVVGRAVRPGIYELDPGAGVLNAVAAAGGLTPFADEDGIYVLRRGYWADGHAEPARIRFKYGQLRAGKPPGVLFQLRVGDVVVVE